MKGFALFALAATLMMSACAQNNTKENPNMKDKKILVAYFSWSGNTAEAAKYIAQQTGADLFEIVTEKTYPADYEPCTEVAKAEKEANARPAIKGKVENMAQYDMVFIGVPVWWYTGPMALFTFLESYNFENKTVIPFCTAYSGPSQTLKDILKATPKSDHRDGICITTQELGCVGMDKKHGEIDKWLKEIGF